MTVLPLAASLPFVCSPLEQIPQKNHLYLLCPVPLLQSFLNQPQIRPLSLSAPQKLFWSKLPWLNKSSGQFSSYWLITSDIINHILLLDTHSSLDFQNTSLSWFSSSLTAPTFLVSFPGSASFPWPLSVDVRRAQTSVLYSSLSTSFDDLI